MSAVHLERHRRVTRRTGISCLRDDLGKELREVREVLTEEVGLQNEGLASVVRGQLTSQKLGFAGDAEGGALVGVLKAGRKLAHRAPDTRELLKHQLSQPN